jgi:prephenate dehydrogenase
MNDQDGFLLSQAKIAILGLGLMGGSLALALKGKCAALYGVDPSQFTRDLAIRQNIVDFVDEDPAVILPLVDLVVLAAPVQAILSLLDVLPGFTPNPCIILDLGSSKAAIVEKMAALPERFDPIGGHPICGKERLSIENADRTLYYAAPFLLTPLQRTSDRARSACYQIISAIGAKPEILDAEQHDRILACTSHMPFLLSSALALATPQEVAQYIGPGFRSASRLAGTPASMMLGVILSNQKNILAALERLQDELALFTAAIAENDVETLNATLASAQEVYFELIGNKQ